MTRQVVNSSSTAFFDDLEQQIADATTATQFQDEISIFLAPSAIARLAAPERIYEALNAESSFRHFHEISRARLAFVIARDCQKLFVICAAQGIPLSFFVKTNTYLRKRDKLTIFVDSDLPLTDTKNVDPSYYASFINRFYPYQYRVLTPQFKSGEFDTPLSSLTAVPIKQGKWIGEGAEGEIYEVRVHRDFFPSTDKKESSTDGTETRSPWSSTYALKVMRDGAPDIAFLQGLRAAGFSHTNLLMSHFGFSYKGKNFLVSDKAASDLEYLFETAEPADIGATSSWLWAQMRGLADALAQIHDLQPGVCMGYLHDIKPGNILVFPVEGQQPVLKFIDWGFANFMSPNESGGSRKTIGGGDPAYAAPEGIPGMKTSRPYDIWSLGCVFLEMLAWFTEGQRGYVDFTTTRTQEFDSNVQFHLNGMVARTVAEKLNGLYEGEWRNEVKIIDAMLRIAPADRITAVQVVTALERYL